MGREDHPGRAEGHTAAPRHRRRDDPADEGRAREARGHPRGGRAARLGDPARRG